MQLMNVKKVLGRGTTAVAIGVLSVAVGGLGVAAAANGGSLTLGHSNSATKTTTLKDSKGTPLSLSGKKTSPPLKVNSSVKVKHLNADEVDGLSAGKLATSGSGVQTAVEADISLGASGPSHYWLTSWSSRVRARSTLLRMDSAVAVQM
jgi:hypothetical protein